MVKDSYNSKSIYKYNFREKYKDSDTNNYKSIIL